MKTLFVEWDFRVEKGEFIIVLENLKTYICDFYFLFVKGAKLPLPVFIRSFETEQLCEELISKVKRRVDRSFQLKLTTGIER